MKPAIEIIPEAIFFQQTNLICEISTSSFSYVFENDVDKKFYGLSVFYFTKDADISEQLKNIFHEQPLLSKNYKKVFISFTGEECVLLPEELYVSGENTLLLNDLYGDIYDNSIATDLIADKKIYNVYRMPVNLHRAIVDQFPFAAINHHYSLLAKQNFTPEELIRLIFYKDTFIAVVIKNNELQLIHTYPYRSGTDIVYHLLHICHQFDLDNMPLYIGGRVEANSELLSEISNYFPNIRFDSLPAEYEFVKELKDLPSHNFSYLYSLAVCV